MAAGARDEVLALLAAGKISAVANLTVRGQRAWGAANAMTDKVQLDAGLVSRAYLGISLAWSRTRWGTPVSHGCSWAER